MAGEALHQWSGAMQRHWRGEADSREQRRGVGVPQEAGVCTAGPRAVDVDGCGAALPRRQRGVEGDGRQPECSSAAGRDGGGVAGEELMGKS